VTDSPDETLALARTAAEAVRSACSSRTPPGGLRASTRGLPP
jgi:hypothetical protein